MLTDEDRCQRYVRLLNKYTDLKWTFGYLGNDYGTDTSERRYYVFASHPGRVGTYRDRIGDVKKPVDLIPMLQGAVELAIVQSFRKEESKYTYPSVSRDRETMLRMNT